MLGQPPCARRAFLVASASAGFAAANPGAKPNEPPEEEVSPAEDLMREHGVLERILVVYEEVILRAEAGKPVPVEATRDAADIVRRFIEDYHEKLEEEFLFPRFEAAGKDVGLVAVLRRQHQAGRRITEEVVRGTAAK